MVIADWTKYYSNLAPVIKAPYSFQWVDGVIEDSGILENLIGNGAVTTDKIGDGAVSTTKIQDAAISTAKIKDAAITNAKIQDAAITNAKISNVSANKITTSTLTAQVNVGSGTGYVKLDGENNRIIINDGSRDIILIGYQLNGF
jgi:hypothetical protein